MFLCFNLSFGGIYENNIVLKVYSKEIKLLATPTPTGPREPGTYPVIEQFAPKQPSGHKCSLWKFNV